MSIARRIIRILAGLGLLATGPAMLMIPSYRASLELGSRLPSLDRTLQSILGELRDRPLECTEGSGRADQISAARFIELEVDVANAAHAVGMAAFSVDDWYVEQAMRLELPGTDGLRAMAAADSELASYIAELRRDPVCREPESSDAERRREEEQRSQAILAKYRTSLEEFVPRLVAARLALETDRPRLGAAAWSLAGVALVGWTLLLVVLRQELRAWKARRAARGGGPVAGS